MLILDLCGGSGAWSKPYADAGYRVEIVDPVRDGRDVRLLQHIKARVHGILAAPPCTVHSYARNRYMPTDAEVLAALSVADACLRVVFAHSGRRGGRSRIHGTSSESGWGQRGLSSISGNTAMPGISRRASGGSSCRR